MVNIWPLFSQVIGGGCPLCRRPGDGICRRCARALPYNRHPCPRCALPLPEAAPPGMLCAECQARTPSFDRVLAPLLYLAPGRRAGGRVQIPPSTAFWTPVGRDPRRACCSGKNPGTAAPAACSHAGTEAAGTWIQSGRRTGPLPVAAAWHTLGRRPSAAGFAAVISSRR